MYHGAAQQGQQTGGEQHQKTGGTPMDDGILGGYAPAFQAALSTAGSFPPPSSLFFNFGIQAPNPWAAHIVPPSSVASTASDLGWQQEFDRARNFSDSVLLERFDDDHAVDPITWLGTGHSNNSMGSLPAWFAASTDGPAQPHHHHNHRQQQQAPPQEQQQQQQQQPPPQQQQQQHQQRQHQQLQQLHQHYQQLSRPLTSFPPAAQAPLPPHPVATSDWESQRDSEQHKQLEKRRRAALEERQQLMWGKRWRTASYVDDDASTVCESAHEEEEDFVRQVRQHSAPAVLDSGNHCGGGGSGSGSGGDSRHWGGCMGFGGSSAAPAAAAHSSTVQTEAPPSVPATSYPVSSLRAGLPQQLTEQQPQQQQQPQPQPQQPQQPQRSPLASDLSASEANGALRGLATAVVGTGTASSCCANKVVGASKSSAAPNNDRPTSSAVAAAFAAASALFPSQQPMAISPPWSEEETRSANRRPKLQEREAASDGSDADRAGSGSGSGSGTGGGGSCSEDTDSSEPVVARQMHRRRRLVKQEATDPASSAEGRGEVRVRYGPAYSEGTAKFQKPGHSNFFLFDEVYDYLTSDLYPARLQKVQDQSARRRDFRTTASKYEVKGGVFYSLNLGRHGNGAALRGTSSASAGGEAAAASGGSSGGGSSSGGSSRQLKKIVPPKAEIDGVLQRYHNETHLGINKARLQLCSTYKIEDFESLYGTIKRACSFCTKFAAAAPAPPSAPAARGHSNGAAAGARPKRAASAAARR